MLFVVKKNLDIHGLLLFFFFFQELEDMLSKNLRVKQGRKKAKFKKTWTENRRREGREEIE